MNFSLIWGGFKVCLLVNYLIIHEFFFIQHLHREIYIGTTQKKPKLWQGSHTLGGEEGLTIHQLLQTGPHHVDVLNPTELELDVCVVVVVLVPFPSSLVGHGIDLQQTTNNIISLPCSLQLAVLLIYVKTTSYTVCTI